MHGSVTEQLELEQATRAAVDPRPGDPHQLADLINEGVEKLPPTRSAAQRTQEQQANAKLRVAFATRGSVARPAGVRFVSPGHEQVQEIFDDGSVRNPYKVNREMSGRQRRHMRKVANRNMRARGLKGDIADVLKGRRVGQPQRPQRETPTALVERLADSAMEGLADTSLALLEQQGVGESPAPVAVEANPVGTSVAAVVVD